MAILKRSTVDRVRLLLALLLALVAMPGVARSQGSAPLEYAVKASYLAKFGPFVRWPPAAMGAGPVRLCVVGEDPFGPLLDQAVQGADVQGRAIQIQRLARVDAQSGGQCHILFLGKAKGQPVAEMLKAVNGLPVLTVTDRSRGVDGGMIEFVLTGGRVRFAVDEGAAGRSGLGISAKLLELAVEVRR